jgi:hypothetical protein
MYSVCYQYELIFEEKQEQDQEQPQGQEIEHYHDIEINTVPYFVSCPSYTIREIRQEYNVPIKSFHQPTRKKRYGKEIIHIASLHPHPDFYFTSDCCQLNMTDHFSQDCITDAVGINGVFFDFKTDYYPIGPYKQHDMETYRPIPNGPIENMSIYEPFFRAITIKDGTLSIDRRSLKEVWEDRSSFSHIMAAGPLLIDNGKNMITDQLLKTMYNGIPIFQCDKPTEEESKKDMTLVKRNHRTLLSCDRLPGELFHLANTNPRSAIAISTSGIVSFICVAGRLHGTLGMDANRLAQVILDHLPDTYMALNIDGGASSNMIHKKDSKLYQSPQRVTLDRYKVGNIISFQKK